MGVSTNKAMKYNHLHKSIHLSRLLTALVLVSLSCAELATAQNLSIWLVVSGEEDEEVTPKIKSGLTTLLKDKKDLNVALFESGSQELSDMETKNKKNKPDLLAHFIVRQALNDKNEEVGIAIALAAAIPDRSHSPPQQTLKQFGLYLGRKDELNNLLEVVVAELDSRIINSLRKEQ